MNTAYYSYILAVAQSGSIRQAAETLHMKQQNLSKIVREMEHYYGITIFKRSHKGVVPTADGLFFLDEVRALLKTLNRMESPFLYPSKGHLSEVEDHIDLYCSGVLGSPTLANILSEFKDYFPRVRLNFFTSPRAQMFQALEDDAHAVGILITGKDLEEVLFPEGVRANLFLQVPMVAATMMNNPEARGMSSMAMKDFLSKEIVLLSQAQAEEACVYELMELYGQPEIQYCIDNVSIFLDVLQQNGHWTICTEALAHQHHLRAIPFQEKVVAQAYVLYREDAEEDLVMKSFLHLLMAAVYE